MIEEARCNAQFVARFEEEGETAAAAVAVIDVLLDAEIRLDGVGESAVFRVIAGETHGARVAHRHIDGHFRAAAHPPSVDRIGGEFADRFIDLQLRLVRDVTNCP